MPETATWPLLLDVTPRYGDLGTDARVSTVALTRWFEDARVGLSLPRFRRLVEQGEHGGGRWLLAAQHVEHVAPIRHGAAVRLAFGIRRVGRTSFAHAYSVETDDGQAASGHTVLVFADDAGPAELPEAMRADLSELMVPAPAVQDDPPRPGRGRHRLAHYPTTVPLRARIGDLDANRHANNVVLVTWYAEGVAALHNEVLDVEWGGPPPELAPWRYGIQYLHEIGYPAEYRVAVAVAGYDEAQVHYELGIFHGERCVGLADATGVRGTLPGEALDACRAVPAD